MGKNLKGKECGKGLSQRKNGLYSARFTDRFGKRQEKYFPTLAEARNWLADAQYRDRHGTAVVDPNMSVDEWFEYWFSDIVGDLAPNTRRNYNDRYRTNIQPVIGKMSLAAVKPMHCKKVFTLMNDEYAGSTIRQTYNTMGTLFKSAKENDLISKHPMDGVTYTKPVKATNDIKFLTLDEQKKFLEVAKRSHNYYQYAFLLETGLRTGELIGLSWDDIDWERRSLTVRRTLEYRHGVGVWNARPPKTASSYRTIPLTEKAYNILRAVEASREDRKQSEMLSQSLEYIDRWTGETTSVVLKDLVFINWRTGEPAKNSSYDTHLYKLCDEAGIKRFCMHALRHTYATRAIERGISPKVLQKLLGHSSITTTMNTYVHVTDDALREAVKQFENSEKHEIGVKMA